ncbi:tyrosine-type recombinase/integrase [Enterococcus casseliflavus]|uniref:tyrosine-type recombinase/integrase n=1 Tax=Enterococcus casseliflavus TaxID=37734 RepID=UPI0034D253F0
MLKEETPRFQVFNDEEIQKILGFYNSKSFKDIMYKENGSIQKMLKDAFVATSNRKSVRASPHSLRHYYCLKSLELGTPIYQLSKNLGHETISITEVYLSHITNDKKVENSVKMTKSPLSDLR